MKTLVLVIISCHFVLGIKAQGSWSIIPNAPTSERFHDITFINDSVGFVGHRYFIYKTQDRGKSWKQTSKFSGSMYFRAIEFLDDSLGFVGNFGTQQTSPGLFRTKNGGKSFENINGLIGGQTEGICALDHINNIIIAAGVYYEPASFFVSNNRGETWTKKEVPGALGFVECIALSDSVFLASGTVSDSSGKSFAGIYKTKDQGNTWKRVAINSKIMSYCWKMQIDNNGRGIGSIENDNYFFYTEDFGETWEIKKVSELAGDYGGVAFLNDSIGWLGNQWGTGLMETRDGGDSWKHVNFGVNINKIYILKDGTALAGGATLYRYSRTTLQSDYVPDDVPFHKININPNPADKELILDLDLNFATSVYIDLVSESGVPIKKLYNRNMNAGKDKLKFEINDIASGIYFIWFRCNEGHRVFKVIIQH